MSSLVNIVIPVHNENISYFEKKSLMQCVRIFQNYHITLIARPDLNFKNYLRLYAFSTARYNDDYPSNIHSYNKRLLSPAFYKTFQQYTYILIYQPDAYVFRDQLEFWCKKNYDFIGAPIPEEAYQILLSNDIQDVIKQKPLFVGNGGFSLRKVSSFINITETFVKEIEYLFNYTIHEDVILSALLNKAQMKLPGNDDAKLFAIDAFPNSTFESSNRSLPFGCHAWYKNDNRYYNNFFWFPKIYPVTGYFYNMFFKIKYMFCKRDKLE